MRFGGNCNNLLIAENLYQSDFSRHHTRFFAVLFLFLVDEQKSYPANYDYTLFDNYFSYTAFHFHRMIF